MLASCLVIILGLFIIYTTFHIKSFKEGLQTKYVMGTIASPTPSPSPARLVLPRDDNSLLFKGTDVYIYNNVEGAECQGRTQKERRHYFAGYEDVYKNKINRYPQESIRFDLLTPIPYSDAFVAPMGFPHPNNVPKSTLSQITYPHPTFPYEIRR